LVKKKKNFFSHPFRVRCHYRVESWRIAAKVVELFTKKKKTGQEAGKNIENKVLKKKKKKFF